MSLTAPSLGNLVRVEGAFLAFRSNTRTVTFGIAGGLLRRRPGCIQGERRTTTLQAPWRPAGLGFELLPVAQVSVSWVGSPAGVGAVGCGLLSSGTRPGKEGSAFSPRDGSVSLEQPDPGKMNRGNEITSCACQTGTTPADEARLLEVKELLPVRQKRRT
jgi:hypothetical protein